MILAEQKTEQMLLKEGHAERREPTLPHSLKEIKLFWVHLKEEKRMSRKRERKQCKKKELKTNNGWDLPFTPESIRRFHQFIGGSEKHSTGTKPKLLTA